MIAGVCTRYGAIISGWLYFPAPIDHLIEVPFLVDTGAQWTTLQSWDILKVPPAKWQGRLAPSPLPLRGLGGTVRPAVASAILAFAHVGGGFTFFALDAVALLLAPLSEAGPSIMGMDVLSHGALLVDVGRGRVEFDVAVGQTLRVPPPWVR